MTCKIEKSRNGYDVLYIDEKATASMMDPIKEAGQWLAASFKANDLTANETIVVLGAGSGYHIQALMKATTQKIVVLDTCQESLEFVKSRTENRVSCLWISKGTTFTEFFARADILEWIFDPFTVLRHRSSMVRNRDLEKIEECLLGRSIESFRAQLEARPTIAAALNGPKMKKLAESKILTNGLVSIRDLTSAWEVASEPTQERRLLRVLEELVR